MRVLFLLVFVLIMFAFAGWITFHHESGRTTIQVETQEIKDATGRIMQRGAEALGKDNEQIPAEQTATPSSPEVAAPPTQPSTTYRY